MSSNENGIFRALFNFRQPRWLHNERNNWTAYDIKNVYWIIKFLWNYHASYSSRGRVFTDIYPIFIRDGVISSRMRRAGTGSGLPLTCSATRSEPESWIISARPSCRSMTLRWRPPKSDSVWPTTASRWTKRSLETSPASTASGGNNSQVSESASEWVGGWVGQPSEPGTSHVDNTSCRLRKRFYCNSNLTVFDQNLHALWIEDLTTLLVLSVTNCDRSDSTDHQPSRRTRIACSWNTLSSYLVLKYR